MESILQEIGIAVLILIGAIILSLLVGRLLTRVISVLSNQTESILDDVIVSAAAFPLRAAILVFALDQALQQLSIIPESWDETISRIFFLLYALIAFVFFNRLLTGLIDWYGIEVAHRTETDLDDKFMGLARRLMRLGLVTIFLIIILDRFGIEVNALIASLGIASLAVALAAQDTLGNIFAGLSIMVDQPFNVGDRVEILDIDTWGDVKEIGIRSTRILTRDNRTVTVPNSIIGQGLVVNYSIPAAIYRVQTHVSIAYGTNIEMARQVMVDAIRTQDWVMQDERIEALFLEFGETGLIFRVRCWISDYVETRRILDRMNSALYNALRKAGIEIPFPQRDLRFVNDLKIESSTKIYPDN
ncbi:MAG: mechanosensitive ion channel family protein [Candidatus Promineifilaceae bacterium]|nr:mechanosensitive ion channel family protein [Candidatus Promineifilaceae bacterium]